MSATPRPGARLPRGRRGLTAATFMALLAGAALGAWLPEQLSGPAGAVMAALDRATALWVDLLRLLVVPLVASHLYLAFRPADARARLGRLGLQSVAVFVGFVAMGQVLAVSGASLLFSGTTLQLTTATTAPEGPAAAGLLAAIGRVADAVASAPSLLTTMAVAIALGLAARRLAPRHHERLDRVWRGVSRLAGGCLTWLLVFAPVAAAGLSWSLTRGQGIAAAGALLWYLAGLCLLLAVMFVVLAVIGGLCSGVPQREWWAALAPSQALALASRSSLATVPALLEAAARVRLPVMTREFVVPFAAGVFKPSTAISGPCTLMFLSLALDIPISAWQLIAFLVVDALISIADIGIPRVMPQMKSLPLYLALGIPVEAYVLARGAAIASDAVKTVVNSTGYLTAAAAVARLQRGGLAAPVSREAS